MVKVLKLFTFLFAFLIAVGIGAVYQSLFLPLEFPEDYIYELPEGKGLSHLSSHLEKEGYIWDARLLNLYARLQGLDKTVKAGEFLFKSGSNVNDLLGVLVKGDSIQRSVTLVEGSTVKEIISMLKQNDVLANNGNLSHQELKLIIDSEYENPEGLLFADTYFFSKGYDVSALIKQSNKKLEKVLEDEWETREKALPLNTPYEALILASIVEKETGLSEERPLIAGVFINRLRKKMRLQTDPTVIYGIGDDYNGNITSRHLKTYTPYNTYRISGLPPTPISIVGREAIHAVLNPDETDYLYFVAKGDGSHLFF